jgi:hypothetical protein
VLHRSQAKLVADPVADEADEADALTPS